MSKFAVLVLMALTSVSAAGRAQSSDALATKWRAVELATARYKDAVARRNSEERRRMNLPVVRTYSGLEVRADTTVFEPALLSRLDSGFALARAEAARLFGVTTDSVMRGGILIITPVVTDRPADSTRGAAPGRVRLNAAGNERHALGSTWPSAGPRESVVQSYFVDWFAIAATRYMPPRVTTWMGARSAIREWTKEDRQVAHFGLVFHSPLPGVACMNGAIAACRAAFGIVADQDTIGAWYDAPTRRARAVGALRFLPGPQAGRSAVDPSVVSRCADSADDSACRMILARAGVPSPTSRISRQQLVRDALVRGGERAFERLRADTALAIDAAIAAAAGVPFDSVVATWRRDVLAARPPSPAPNAAEWLLGVTMMTVAFGVAVGRKPS